MLTLSVGLFSFDKKVTIGYEVNYGYSILGPVSFDDDQPYAERKAQGWINDINSGNSLTTQILINLPYGFSPFFGLYFGNFPEKKNNQDLWRERYYDNLDYELVSKYSGSRLSGFHWGLKYKMPIFKGPINPVLSVKNTHYRYRNDNLLKAEIYNRDIEEPSEEESSSLYANTNMTTKKDNDWVFGFGFEYDVGQLTLSCKMDIIKSSAKINNRYKSVCAMAEGYNNHVYEGHKIIPDDHDIDFTRKEISLGLIYNFETKPENVNHRKYSHFKNLSAEINFSGSVPGHRAFYKKITDPFDSRSNINAWKFIKLGRGFSVNLVYNTPYWFQLYHGINYTKYGYNKDLADKDILSTIDPFIIDRKAIYDLKRYSFDYYNKGVQAGMYIHLAPKGNKVIPLLQVEGLLNQLSIKGNIKATQQIYDPERFGHNTQFLFEGYVKEKLDWRFGYGLGTGFKYRIGRFNIKPMVKYTKFLEAEKPFKIGYELFSLDGEESYETLDYSREDNMKIEYYTVGIGLEYDL